MKVLILVICTLLFTILLLTPSIIMKDMINGHVTFNKIYVAEDFNLTSDKLDLSTTDGLNIRAYEIYEHNPRAVVIFLSGIHNPSVTAFYGHARLLKDYNFASILLEMRAHGESDGDIISLGYKEYMDVEAVVNYIIAEEKHKDVPIVVYGLSMGGATAINVIGKIDKISG
ncbi:alpha/beta hydrolase [Serpentinicella alkaliphila]|uniref:alpha/beta hydrolase n=1 Tax=Serpentinicella alkaliphila TaxID=1734049 RepID=UPI001043FA36|nr:alpha/beta hydrolase [Serpentinicella alkaliphila]QUH26100.1 alpha/beta hydrolase [Serpentinicella alkaliphila]